MSNDAVKELFDRWKSIDGEIRCLQEDKKALIDEFKDRVDPKAFKAALGAAKAKARLKPTEANNFDLFMDLLADELCIGDEV